VPSPYAIVPAGFLVGLLYGTVGVGGAVLGTPALALLGVPGITAVATPLVPTIPAAIAAAFNYRRRGDVDPSVVLRALVGAVPAVILGALLSDVVGGPVLLAISGVVLGLVGVRLIVLQDRTRTSVPRSDEPATIVVVGWCAAAGLFTGLLANGGTFVFIPLFVLVLDLGYRRSVGTSLVVAATLSIPAVIAHAALGHIDWTVAAYFGLGLIPGAAVGSHLAPRIDESALQRTLGWLLVVFAASFLTVRLVT
jgi:hypothetical protein